MTASFDGTTQYSTDYRPRAAGERAQMTQRERYNPNEAPFDGEPTYRRDYQPYEGATMTRSMKPVDPGFSSGAPLDEGRLRR